MKAMLTMNPRSGKKRALTIRAAAERMAKELDIELDIRAIEGPGHGTELAREAVRNGYARVISAGGDGTTNATATGLIGTDVALGLVPMGSGNGYPRSVGLPLDPEKALRIALTKAPRLMDVCYLNDVPFLGTAGIGFDARVAHRFDQSKGRGMLGYMKIIVQEVFGAPPMHVRIEVPGTPSSTTLGAGEKKGAHVVEEDVLMLVFCNTREFGNGAVISPGSKPDDGLAELRVVTKPSFFPLLRAFVQIYTHRADRCKSIRNITTTEATVVQAGTLAHLDGEPLEIGHEVRFRLEPQRLWVVA